MKNLLLLFIFLMGGKLIAQKTAVFVEWQNILPFPDDKKGLIVLKGQLQSKFENKEIGFNAFFLVNPDWAQAILGITWQPKNTMDEFNFTLGAGIETDSMPLRAQTSLYFRANRFTNLAVFEFGGSGYWYLLVPQYHINEFVKVGLHLERYVGIGPRIEVSTSSIGIWISPTYDFEDDSAGINSGVFAFF